MFWTLLNEYFLNEYYGFCFESNFELNEAQFNEQINFFPNVSPTPKRARL